MMFATLCLALTLLYPPIPKGSTYEGKIAILVRSPTPTVILINPDGKEIKRFDVSELGNPTTIKNTRNSDAVMVTTQSLQGLTDAYLVPCDGKEKPKKLLSNYGYLRWVVNSDTSKIIGTGRPAGVGDAGDTTGAFEIDVASGKVSEFTIPGQGVSVLDLAADNDTLLLQDPNSTSGVSFYSLKAKSISTPSGFSMSAYGVSPDGKMLFGYVSGGEAKGQTTLGLVDHARKSTIKIEMPEGMSSANFFSCGADNKRVVFGQSVGKTDNGRRVSVYRIATAGLDGKNAKVIYETKPGEVVADIDWR